MKTIKNQLKILTMLLILIFSNTSTAQNEQSEIRVFLRIYNMEGKKINKGHFQFINDSILGIRRDKKTFQIHVRDIGQIKTKRSVGYNVLVGATSGLFAGAILGSLNAPTDSSGGTFTWAGGSSGDELASGLTVGILSGTIIGGITALFKNSTTYLIDGDPAKLKLFAETIFNNE